MEKIQINNRIIGHVTHEHFVKTLRESKHFLKKPPAIAFDVETLDKALELKAHTVFIREIDNNLYYRAKIKKIMEEGFTFNRGHGNQIALVLEKWMRDCIVCFDKDYIIKSVDCGCPDAE